jgi:hypothetical protein
MRGCLKSAEFSVLAAIPPVIANHGLAGRSRLKQAEEPAWIGFESLQWTLTC